MKKKWWIINQHSEGNAFYMVQATEEEIKILEELINNDPEYDEDCLYFDYYWGNVEIASPGFATREECKEYFKTAEEFKFFR